MQLGTCYMHLGYEPVRKLLEDYGLGDTEVGLGAEYLQREKNGAQRKVWDLKKQGDFARGDLKGQDFDDWLLRTADQVCVVYFLVLASLDKYDLFGVTFVVK